MPSPPETIAASMKRTALRGSEKTSLRGDWPQCMQCVQANSCSTPLYLSSSCYSDRDRGAVETFQRADLVSPEIQESEVREWLTAHVGLEYHGRWFGMVKNKIVDLEKLLTNVFLSSCTLMAGLVLGSFREPTERGKGGFTKNSSTKDGSGPKASSTCLLALVGASGWLCARPSCEQW